MPSSKAGSTAKARRDLVNLPTRDGNTALMWAAWSGALEAAKLLVRYRADPLASNRNGCTVAHWAASGGSLDVCRYLRDVCGVDFTEPNLGGNTPLTHAVAFGRSDVVRWLREDVLSDAERDDAAYRLARDFVHWNSDGTEDRRRRRREVLELFREWSEFDDGGEGGKIEGVGDNDDLDFF